MTTTTIPLIWNQRNRPQTRPDQIRPDQTTPGHGKVPWTTTFTGSTEETLKYIKYCGREKEKGDRKKGMMIPLIPLILLIPLIPLEAGWLRIWFFAIYLRPYFTKLTTVIHTQVLSSSLLFSPPLLLHNNTNNNLNNIVNWCIGVLRDHLAMSLEYSGRRRPIMSGTLFPIMFNKEFNVYDQGYR